MGWHWIIYFFYQIISDHKMLLRNAFGSFPQLLAIIRSSDHQIITNHKMLIRNAFGSFPQLLAIIRSSDHQIIRSSLTTKCWSGMRLDLFHNSWPSDQVALHRVWIRAPPGAIFIIIIIIINCNHQHHSHNPTIIILIILIVIIIVTKKSIGVCLRPHCCLWRPHHHTTDTRQVWPYLLFPQTRKHI